MVDKFEGVGDVFGGEGGCAGGGGHLPDAFMVAAFCSQVLTLKRSCSST
jgi:hypothetical protein